MGPLEGLRFIEMGGIGPGPFCGMLLADMGADVITVHRPGHEIRSGIGLTERGKRSITLNMKEKQDVQRLLSLCEYADGLFEGFRPGVMERLGVGPHECLSRNPRLVYGRLSGFGQDGPLAQKAGHDINYLAQSGVFDLIRDEKGCPVIPGNLIADYGGGSLHMALGLMCAIYSAKMTGKGQVVDLAISEGAASLASLYFLGNQSQILRTLLSGKAPYYSLYQTSDDEYVSVGCIEPQFYQRFLEVMQLQEDEKFKNQHDPSAWEENRKKLQKLFKTKTRGQWAELFESVDCCVFAVKHFDEIAKDPQMIARQNFWTYEDASVPSPNPRFSATPVSTPKPPARVGAHTKEVFEEFGLN